MTWTEKFYAKDHIEGTGGGQMQRGPFMALELDTSSKVAGRTGRSTGGLLPE